MDITMNVYVNTVLSILYVISVINCSHYPVIKSGRKLTSNAKAVPINFDINYVAHAEHVFIRLLKILLKSIYAQILNAHNREQVIRAHFHSIPER